MIPLPARVSPLQPPALLNDITIVFCALRPDIHCALATMELFVITWAFLNLYRKMNLLLG